MIGLLLFSITICGAALPDCRRRNPSWHRLRPFAPLTAGKSRFEPDGLGADRNNLVHVTAHTPVDASPNGVRIGIIWFASDGLSQIGNGLAMFTFRIVCFAATSISVGEIRF